MGYTHYWDAPKRGLSHAQWNELTKIALAVIEDAKRGDIKVCWESDEPDRAPQVDSETIRFNGVGDEGHETFILDRRGGEWGFCKTARKPYDVIVCAILLAAQPFGYKVTSDGDMQTGLPDAEGWDQGRALLARVR